MTALILISANFGPFVCFRSISPTLNNRPIVRTRPIRGQPSGPAPVNAFGPCPLPPAPAAGPCRRWSWTRLSLCPQREFGFSISSQTNTQKLTTVVNARHHLTSVLDLKVDRIDIYVALCVLSVLSNRILSELNFDRGCIIRETMSQIILRIEKYVM